MVDGNSLELESSSVMTSTCKLKSLFYRNLVKLLVVPHKVIFFLRMEDLQRAACQVGKPQWGNKGPQNAGGYNSIPFGIPFFEEGQESFLSDYGQFFLVS